MQGLKRRLDRLEAAIVDERPLSDEARLAALAALIRRGLLTVDAAGDYHPGGELSEDVRETNVLARIAELLNIARKRAGL